MTTVSAEALRVLVLAATIATTAAPILLLALFVRDAVRGKLW
jgi:hypothetical protein